MEKKKYQSRQRLENFLFVIPSLLFVAMVFYVPFLMSGYYSLTEWNGISKEPEFIGFENFVHIFTVDKTFIKAMLFTGKYMILFVAIVNVLGILLAVLLVKKLKTANLLRAIFFVPYIMSMIVVGFIWKFIFLQGFTTMESITGWGIFRLSWLGDEKLAFVSILLVSVWQALGFYVVLYIAGLQAIPEDVLEAAVVDGASGKAGFFKITLPLLGGSITTCIFLALTNAIKIFDVILALTGGGPGGATYSVTLDVYREAFQNNNFGLGSAKALILFITVLLLTNIVLKLLKSREADIC